MKIERSRSKSGLFLIELIIAIVFFAVASAICIQLFVKAHLISAHSADLSAANMIAQNYAERYKAAPYEEKQRENAAVHTLYYGYDGNRRLVALGSDPVSGASYQLSATLDDSFAPTLTVKILVFKFDGQPPDSEAAALCSLDVKSYDAQSAQA